MSAELPLHPPMRIEVYPAPAFARHAHLFATVLSGAVDEAMGVCRTGRRSDRLYKLSNGLHAFGEMDMLPLDGFGLLLVRLYDGAGHALITCWVHLPRDVRPDDVRLLIRQSGPEREPDHHQPKGQDDE